MYSWNWTDPDIAPFVPDWYREVYDTELEGDEKYIFNALENIRRMSQGSDQWLASIAIRMLVRDGVMALLETGKKGGTLGRLLGLSEQLFLDGLLDDDTSAAKEWRDVGRLLESGRHRPLHKLEHLRRALADHDFSKAVVFVDRVTIARALKKEFFELNPVLLLGRLHGGTEVQERALREARKSDMRLLVATSAAKEGLDVPEVDMVVTWPITPNPVRFAQRQGRGMQLERDEKRGRPKVNLFLATPDTPDYDALYRGITAVEAAHRGSTERLNSSPGQFSQTIT